VSKKLAKVGTKKVAAAQRQSPSASVDRDDDRFAEVVSLIETAHREASRAVNVQLIELYWKIGEVISRRIERDGWGKALLKSWRPILRERSAVRVGSRRRTSGECASSSRPTETLQNSQLVRELPWSTNLHMHPKCWRSRSDRESARRCGPRGQPWRSERRRSREGSGKLFKADRGDQRAEIFEPIAQRRQHHLEPGGPRVEILAVGAAGGDVLMGSRDDSDVDLDRLVRADRADFTLGALARAMTGSASEAIVASLGATETPGASIEKPMVGRAQDPN